MRYKKGSYVNIVGVSDGEFMLEGTATILKCVDSKRDSYLVQFGGGDILQRYVDPNAQGTDVDAYIESLNSALKGD